MDPFCPGIVDSKRWVFNTKQMSWLQIYNPQTSVKRRALQVQVGAEDYIHVKIFEFLKHERKAPILADVEPLNLKISDSMSHES